LDALLGVWRYEFWMQFRRPATWIAIGLGGLVVGGGLLLQALPSTPNEVRTPPRLVGTIAYGLNVFLPIIYGILLADRLPRDRWLHTDELLASYPVGLGRRLWGKYLGASVATMIPVALVHTALVGVAAVYIRDGRLIGLVPAAFGAIVLPGLLFVGAFSIVCTEVLWVPLYSILFIGYWFWGNVVSPSMMPTLSCSPLQPMGGYAQAAFFGDPNGCFDPDQHVIVSAVQGWESIVLLLGCAALAMLVGQAYMAWHAARR
jgi:ABC-2 type transport system permease protein